VVDHDRLLALRADPDLLASVRQFYADPVNTAQFITDWAVTVDPVTAPPT
jgi:hypothetical protein